jgi:nucleoside-diphosphate-sugar epimerase
MCGVSDEPAARASAFDDERSGNVAPRGRGAAWQAWQDARVMKEKLLVLGGGFTGAAVARFAIARGVAVVATTRSTERAAALRALGVTPLVSARLDASTIAGHVDDDTLVLATFPPHPVDAASATADVAGVVGVVGRARAMAYVSSTGVYGGASGKVDEETPVDRDAPRAAARLDAEDMWRRAGATIVRAPAIYGPGRGLHLRLARGEVKVAPPSTNAISRIHVDDLAAALFTLLASGASSASSASGGSCDRGAVYVIGDLEPSPHVEVVRWLCDALAIPPPAFDQSGAVDETLTHDRRVDAAKIRERLGLALSYPTYREGYAQCIARDRDALDAALAARAARPE